MDQYGRPTAGQNFEMGCKGMGAGAVMDGLDTAVAHFNPEGDMSDAEIWERVFPFVWLGRGIVVDGGGTGRYRGGGSIESLYVVDHVDAMQISTPLTHSKVFHSAGLMGGYPPICGGQCYYFDTDFRAAALGHAPIPHSEGDDPSRPTWLDLLTGRPSPHDDAMPTKMTRRHDLISVNHGGGGGYGDPLERDPEHVALDLRNGLTTLRTARQVYGVVLESTGVVDAEATRQRRQEIRAERRSRAVPARQYLERERERVEQRRVHPVLRDLYKDVFRLSQRFARDFRAYWGLSDGWAF
jgi:acetone carboxylase alpha subunit